MYIYWNSFLNTKLSITEIETSKIFHIVYVKSHRPLYVIKLYEESQSHISDIYFVAEKVLCIWEIWKVSSTAWSRDKIYLETSSR